MHASALALLAVLVFNAQAEVSWVRNMTVPNIPSDDSWGPVYEKGGSRLQCDAAGSLYLSLGDSLLIGEDKGRTWRKPALPPVPNVSIVQDRQTRG